MNTKSCFITIQLLVVIIWNLSAQIQIPETVLKSPTASSIGAYGELPEASSIGRPIIELPLYRFQQNNLDVPIQLSYNASGVKPDERPGWVGLNWSLSAGGLISRKVNDMPDEYDARTPKLKRYYYGYSQLNTSSSFFDFGVTGENAGYFFQFSAQSATHNLSYMNMLVNNDQDARDTQPDEFHFNFLSYSGKFFLSESGEWKVQSDHNFKVIFDNDFMDLPTGLMTVGGEENNPLYLANCYKNSNNLKSFAGFRLIGDDGTQFIFGKTTNAIEYSIQFQTQLAEHWVASSWYLTKIILTNGEVLDFTYEPDNFIANMNVSFFWNLDLPLTSSNKVACGLYGNIVGAGDNLAVDWITPRYSSYAGDLIRPVYLKEIKGKHVKVTFNRENTTELNYDVDRIFMRNRGMVRLLRRDFPAQFCRAVAQQQNFLGEIDWPYLHNSYGNPNGLSLNSTTYARELIESMKWKKLTNITVQPITDSAFPTMTYTFQYNDNPNERLMLKSVNNEELVHSFDYYNDLQLPEYLIEATDFWGYFNGNTVKTLTGPRNSSFIHANAFTIPQYISRREPTNSIQIATAGSLKTITYPTGGTTTFEYEQHKISKSLNSNNTTIESQGSNVATGGLRIKRVIVNPLNGPQMTYRYFYLLNFSTSTNPETLLSSGILSGKPVYQFFITTNYNIGNVRKVETQILSSQNMYPLGANTIGPHVTYSEVSVQREDNSYTKYKYTNFVDYLGSHFDEPVSVITSSTGYLNSSNDKSIERGKVLSHEIYSPTDFLLKNTNYTYQKMSDDHVRSLNLTATVLQCGENELPRTYAYSNKIYFYRYLPINETTIDYTPIASTGLVKSRDIVYNTRGQIVQTQTTGSDGKLVTVDTKYPSDMASGVRGSDLLIAKNIFDQVVEQETKLGSQFTSRIQNTYNTFGGNVMLASTLVFPTAGTQSLLTVYSYDNATGKMLQKMESDGSKTSYVWGYNSTYPIAVAENCHESTMNSALSSLGLTRTYLDGLIVASTIRNKMELVRTSPGMEKAMVRYYTFIPSFGVQTFTDPNGKTIYYEYDDLGRLKLIRDTDDNIVNTFEYNYKTE